MRFDDRRHAGRELGELVAPFIQGDATVLAVPNGGVPVGYEVANRLHAPLDVILTLKIVSQRTVAVTLGALGPGGTLVLDRTQIERHEVTQAELADSIDRARLDLAHKTQLYRADQYGLDIEGRMAIIVDDGIATGSSALAAVAVVRQMNPAQVVLAVPVAAGPVRDVLRGEVDHFVAVESPGTLLSISSFYGEFPTVTDGEVLEILDRARRDQSFVLGAINHATRVDAAEARGGI